MPLHRAASFGYLVLLAANATVNKCPSAEAGIYYIDPVTLKTKSVVNNFISHPFNSPNDLAVSPGGIWFTHPPYAANIFPLSETAPCTEQNVAAGEGRLGKSEN
jgi:sugar lactone lactonase YvrE